MEKRCGSAPGRMSLLKVVGLLFLGREIRLDLLPVCVEIGKTSVHLGEREVAELVHNLFGAESKLIPADDSPDSYARSCQARPSTADFRTTNNESADVGDLLHESFDSESLPPPAGPAMLVPDREHKDVIGFNCVDNVVGKPTDSRNSDLPRDRCTEPRELGKPSEHNGNLLDEVLS